MASSYDGVFQVTPGSVLTLKPVASGWVSRGASASPPPIFMRLVRAGARACIWARRTAESSVRDHLIADVPVAVVSSGGLDSR